MNSGIISIETLLRLKLALENPNLATSKKIIEAAHNGILYAAAFDSAAPAFVRDADGKIKINPKIRQQFQMEASRGNTAAKHLLALDKGELTNESPEIRAYLKDRTQPDRPFSTEEALKLLSDLQAGKTDENHKLNELAQEGASRKLFIRLENPRRYGLNPIFEPRLQKLIEDIKDEAAHEILSRSKAPASFEAMTAAIHRRQAEKSVPADAKFFTLDGAVQPYLVEKARRDKSEAAQEFLATVEAFEKIQKADPEKEVAPAKIED